MEVHRLRRRLAAREQRVRERLVHPQRVQRHGRVVERHVGDPDDRAPGTQTPGDPPVVREHVGDIARIVALDAARQQTRAIVEPQTPRMPVRRRRLEHRVAPERIVVRAHPAHVAAALAGARPHLVLVPGRRTGLIEIGAAEGGIASVLIDPPRHLAIVAFAQRERADRGDARARRGQTRPRLDRALEPECGEREARVGRVLRGQCRRAAGRLEIAVHDRLRVGRDRGAGAHGRARDRHPQREDRERAPDGACTE
jgi:hypothetical protein